MIPFIMDCVPRIYWINGEGIYENLGLINLVYTYSKGAEVLVLPLSGTPTYGFLLSFTFWTTTVSVITAVVIGTRYGGKKAGFLDRGTFLRSSRYYEHGSFCQK